MVERVCRVPASSRSGIVTGKSILRSAIADLLPPELHRQPKRGFPVPLSRLLFTASRHVPALLLSERSLDRGLYDREELTQLARGEGISSEQRELKLFTLLSLELWLRANVDEIRLEPPGSLAELADDTSVAEGERRVVA
jgi:asparagine synthase (glutamine-hydrolysing)